MTVHEVLQKYGCLDFWESPSQIEVLEAELRQAAIVEASIGEITVEEHEGYLSPEPMLTWTADTKLKPGKYYLVPKEEK